MSYTADLPEFTFESATQSDEELNKVVTSLGFEVDTPEPAEETPAAAEPETEAAAETTELEETPETPAAAAPPANQEPDHGKSRAAKTREKVRLQAQELARMKTELEELKKQVTARPGETPATEAPKPVAAEPPKPAEPEAADDPEPTYDEEKHASYEAYLKELVRWERRQAVREEVAQKKQAEDAAQRAKQAREQSEAQSRAKADEDALQTRWNSDVAAAEVRFDDWKTVMTTGRTERPHEAVVASVRLRDDVNTAELAYYLAKFPEKEKALNQVATTLPANASQVQITQVMRKLDRMLDPIVAELEAYQSDDNEDETGTAVEPPAAAPAVSSQPLPPVAANAAKSPPQQPPPGQAAAARATEAKPKPQVPTPVGSRGSTRNLSVMERAQRGEHVDPDEYRREWEKRNGQRPLV